MRARGKVGLYFITGIKETQNGTHAAPPTRARITSTLTQQIKDAGSRSALARARVSSIKKGTSENLGIAHAGRLAVWPLAVAATAGGSCMC